MPINLFSTLLFAGAFIVSTSLPIAGWAQTTFSPDDALQGSICADPAKANLAVSRADMAVIMVQAFDIDSRRITTPEAPPTQYTDVPEDFWAKEAIEVMSRHGLMRGYRPGLFYPQQKITRGEGFAIIGQSFGVFQFNDDYIDGVLNAYQDNDQLPEWARKAVATSVVSGLVDVAHGTNAAGETTLQLYPSQPMTCQSLVNILNRYNSHVNPQ